MTHDRYLKSPEGWNDPDPENELVADVVVLHHPRRGFDWTSPGAWRRQSGIAYVEDVPDDDL